MGVVFHPDRLRSLRAELQHRQHQVAIACARKTDQIFNESTKPGSLQKMTRRRRRWLLTAAVDRAAAGGRAQRALERLQQTTDTREGGIWGE